MPAHRPVAHTAAQTAAPADLAVLVSLLDALPAPLEPPDPMALDGYLCGVLLQPRPVPAAEWLRWVLDVEGRQPPPGLPLAALHQQLERRHAELERAIAGRQWFDPWVFEPDEDSTSVAQVVLPWVAGFAAAMDQFPEVMNHEDPALVEPLALLYRHFDPEDLEDADALLELIETLEPPADLSEAVEDLVRSVLLIADVTRPVAVPTRAAARGPRRPVRNR